MFKFDNINKVLDAKAMVDTTVITQLNPEMLKQVLDEANNLNMSEKLSSIVKNLISKCGIVKDAAGEAVVVNAICFFRSPVKGIGAMLDDPIFRLYELDVTSANAVVTDYVLGGIISKNRDIANYNKTRQFHKDDIMCIIPLNERGFLEYANADEFILNMNNRENNIDINDTVFNDVVEPVVENDEVDSSVKTVMEPDTNNNIILA